VINKQRRNVSQIVFHTNKVALSQLHMQVNFFDKTCDLEMDEIAIVNPELISMQSRYFYLIAEKI
jgi:hypothetical protein